MYYSQDVIDDVRIGNDIVEVVGSYVKLTKRGSNYLGLCPFHHEKTPSFSVNSEGQYYKCFGCGEGGNVFSFVMKHENYSFPDAVKFLAQRISYTLPEVNYSEEANKKRENRKILCEIHKVAARFYYKCLNEQQGQVAVEYLDKRKIAPNIRKKFGLGYSPVAKGALYKQLKSEGYSDEMILKSGLVYKRENGEIFDKFFNRLMFPIIDIYGNIIGFGGRVLGDAKPKYLNSPETDIFSKSHNLYNLNFAKSARNTNKEFILVEGYMDAIAIFQAGFYNVVASLGTAFNENHARTLKAYANSVILLFDSDEAGEKAVIRAIPVLENAGLKVKVLQVHDAKDPDEFIKKFGSDEFGKLLDTAESQVMFRVKHIRKNYNLDLLEERINFTNEVSKILAELDNPIETDAYSKEIAAITGIDMSAIRKQISNISNNVQIPHISNTGIRSTVKGNYTDKKNGVDDARRSIINILAFNKDIFEKTRNMFSAEELSDELYITVMKAVEELHNANKPIVQADLVSRFDNVEEQKRVIDIFILKTDFSDREDLQKAVNDQMRVVKLAYYDELLKKETAKADRDDSLILKYLKKKNESIKFNVKI
jgi:DNA primase